MANGKHTKTQDLQKREPTTMALPQEADLPAWMRGQAGKGLERIGMQDVEVPRIKLLQGLSPELHADESLRPGMWFHTVAEVGLGRSIRVIPVFVDTGYILWRPRGQGGGILARAADGVHWSPSGAAFEVIPDGSKNKVEWKTRDTVIQSGLAEWGSTDPSDPNSPPAATLMYNIVVVMPDHPALSPAVVTMQRSSIKTARKLLAKLKLSAAPIYGLQMVLSSETDKNSQGQEYMGARWSLDGLVQDEGLFAVCKSLYERYTQSGLRVRDLERAQDDEPAAPPSMGGGNAF